MSRPLRRLNVDGIDLDPSRVMVDGFEVDYAHGAVRLTIRFDTLQVSYEEPDEFEGLKVGDVVLLKPAKRARARVLELRPANATHRTRALVQALEGELAALEPMEAALFDLERT